MNANYITAGLLFGQLVVVWFQLRRSKRQMIFLRAVQAQTREVWGLTVEALKVLELHDDATARLLRQKVRECADRHDKIIGPLL